MNIISFITGKFIEALVILLFIFLLGLIVPLLVSSLFVIFGNDTSYYDCASSFPFIMFTIIGWLMAGCYINEEVTKVIKSN